jgi:AraC-like DNA-binding protein
VAAARGGARAARNGVAMSAPPIADIQRWSTRDIAAGQRLAFYSDVISSALDPMVVARAVTDPFDGEITATRLGPLILVHGVSTAHDCVRGGEHVALSTSRQFHLIVNRRSGWNLRHRDWVHVGCGDAVLLDSSLGHYLNFAQAFDNVHLVLPEAWLGQWLPDPAAFVGKPLPNDAVWARALTGFLAQHVPENLQQGTLPTHLIVDHVGALLALCANQVSGEAMQPVLRQRQLRDLVQDAIVQRCTEQTLGAVEVALAVGISVRTLHRTLAACDQTFGGLLMSARVALATRMLESPLMARLTISEIGRRAGFADPSHFARVFRRHSGITPARLRRDRR